MIVVQAPLRVSFAGGGTDFEDFYVKEGGAVLSTAISLSIYVVIKERFDEMIYVNYSRKEIVDKVDDLQHELVREAMLLTGVEKGVEITTLADVTSEGSGLGSSSSFTVGLLHALYAYKGELKTAEALASEACHIEIDILGKPIGRQDQYIAAFGNMRFITFSNSAIRVEKIDLPKEGKMRLNRNLMLFNTGRNRKSESILEDQKEKIEVNKEELHQMKNLAFQARGCLLEDAFDKFGEIIHNGWEYKKTLSSWISDSEINQIYDTARKAGAIGGKICGAGGGGFLLLYCRPEKQEDVRRALRSLKEYPFRFQEDGSKVIFNYRG